jgi:hypothetical protein
MKSDKNVEVTLAHEFWCCKREFNQFMKAIEQMLTVGSSKEVRLEAFTAYGNFIRLFYSFYEGIIKHRNPELLRGVKEKMVGPEISQLLYLEVKKLIRNRVAVYKGRSDLDHRDIQDLVEADVPKAFGTDFRQMRNRFAHPIASRVEPGDMTLFEFFKRYHKYMLLMYWSCEFTWNISNADKYDWKEIDNFFNYAQEANNTITNK